MELVRCFVAVEVAGTPAGALQAMQEELRSTRSNVKWTQPSQFHLTLKFLGEVPPATVAAAREALAPVFAQCAPFTLGLGGLGAFPAPERAQVIWAGVTQGAETLGGLARAVEAALVPAGLQPEGRPFRPHFTLGRVREGGLTPTLTAAIRAGKQRDFGRVEVTEAVFMRSQLTAAGPTYTPIATFSLRGDSAGPST